MIVNTRDSATADIEAIVYNLKKEVSELLTDVKNEVMNSVGTVKSVQRGTVTGIDGGSVTITINPVNPDKCMVLINSSYISADNYTSLSYLISITETTLTIGTNRGATYKSDKTSWQVVEFY